MKNPTKRNNLNTRHHKGWNQLNSDWHTALVGTNKVKSGEHALPCPPNKPGGIHGTKMTLVLICAWTVCIICKIMEGVIKRKRWLKSNKTLNKMRGSSPQNQRSILDTNNCKLKKPIPNDGQRSIRTETKEIRTITSTDTRLGAAKTQWVHTRHWGKSDGMMNATIGDIQKAIDDEFNNNVRSVMLSKHPEPQMTVKPQKMEDSPNIKQVN